VTSTQLRNRFLDVPEHPIGGRGAPQHVEDIVHDPDVQAKLRKIQEGSGGEDDNDKVYANCSEVYVFS
jgi:hypothetical protein